VGEGDSVIFKTITQPSLKDFGNLMAVARRQARKEGIARSDVVASIRRVRKR
jgi:hypothetical protein